MIGLILAMAWLSGCTPDRQKDALEAADVEESKELVKSLPPINPEDVMRYGREVYLLRNTGSTDEESSAAGTGADGEEDGAAGVGGDGTGGGSAGAGTNGKKAVL